MGKAFHPHVLYLGIWLLFHVLFGEQLMWYYWLDRLVCILETLEMAARSKVSTVWNTNIVYGRYLTRLTIKTHNNYTFSRTLSGKTQLMWSSNNHILKWSMKWSNLSYIYSEHTWSTMHSMIHTNLPWYTIQYRKVMVLLFMFMWKSCQYREGVNW